MIVLTVRNIGPIKWLLRDSFIELDCAMTVSRKPIALITDDIAYGIQWALTNFRGNIDSYSNGKRRIILKSGQEYILCTRPEELLAMEISDYKDIGGCNKPSSWYIDMIEMAGSRIR